MWNQDSACVPTRMNLTGWLLNGCDQAALLLNSFNGGKAHNLRHVCSQTHRGRPVLLCQTELQPSIKVTAVQTGIRTDVWISAAEHIQETFSPNEWVIESAQGAKLSMKVGPVSKLPLAALSSVTSSKFFPSSSPTAHKREKKKVKRVSCKQNSSTCF